MLLIGRFELIKSDVIQVYLTESHKPLKNTAFSLAIGKRIKAGEDSKLFVGFEDGDRRRAASKMSNS